MTVLPMPPRAPHRRRHDDDLELGQRVAVALHLEHAEWVIAAATSWLAADTARGPA